MPLLKHSPTSSTTASAVPQRWRRQDWIRSGVLFAVIAAMHLVAFVILAALVAPHHYTVGKQVFGVGLGITASTLGMR